MATEDDTEKKIQAFMDKIFATPHRKPNNPISRDQSPRGKKRGSSVLSFSSSESGASRGSRLSPSSVPAECRPWDREDLLKRLATFKSMTWFGKPKAVSAVNCARRGWVNVEIDTIACKICGARLVFSIPPSWTQQTTEKEAAIFSLKLDNGHNRFCPWINNACDESLAQFPPTLAPILVDGYRKRASTLLRLSALPIISSSAIGYASCSQLERFLEQSSVDFGIGSVVTGRTEDLDHEHAASANLYYQAHKLISLCGWEPRSLPYAVDSNGWSTQSTQNRYHEERSPPILKVQKPGGVMHLMSNEDGEGESLNSLQSDPASIVLDCKFCGASAGLWAFSTVQRPLEWFRIVDSLEVNGQNDVSNSDDKAISCIASAPRLDDSSGKKYVGHDIGRVKAPTSSRESLNSSIAGGPLPAKQNYRATVSLPMISRHLGAALSSKSDDRLQPESGQTTPCKLIVQSKDIETVVPGKNGEELGISKGNDHSHLNVNDPSRNEKNSGTSLEGHSVVGQEDPMHAHESESQGKKCDTIAPDGRKLDGMPMTEASSHQLDVVFSEITQVSLTVSSSPEARMISGGASTMNSQKDGMGSHCTNTFDLKGTNGKLHGVNKMQHTLDNETVDSAKYMTQLAANNQNVTPLGFVTELKRAQFDQTMEFDPIRLHRHFCPWILPTGKTRPGWQLTLAALDSEKASSPTLLNSPFLCISGVDDPITSVRNLSECPLTKRIRTSCDSER